MGFPKEERGAALFKSILAKQFNWWIIGGLTGKGARKPPVMAMHYLVHHIARIYNTPIFIKSNAGVGPQKFPEGLKI
jgi:hypothetical protein